MPDPDTLTQSASPEVAPGAALPDQVNPVAEGAGVGASAEQGMMVGKRVLFDQQQRQQRTADQAEQVEANGAINQLHMTGLQGLHGDGGLFTTNPGVGAIQAAKTWQQQRQQQVDQLRAKLTTDGARASFDKAVEAGNYSNQASIDQWQEHQVQKADVATTDASLQTAYNGVIANASNPEQFNHWLAMGATAHMDHAARMGVPPEQIKGQTKDQIADWTSHAVTGAISTLVDSGETVKAQALADAHKGEIQGDDVGHVAKLLAHGDVQDRSLALAGEIIKSVPAIDPTNPDHDIGATRDAALAKLDQYGITDGKLYDETQRRILTHFHLAEGSANERQGNLLTQAFQQLDKPDNVNGEVAPSVMAGMDWKSLKAVDAARSKKIAENQGARYDQWQQTFAAAGSPEDLGPLRTQLLQDRPNMSPAMFQQLDKQFGATMAHLQQKSATLAQGIIPHEVAKSIFDENGMSIPADAKPGTAAFQSISEMRGNFTQQLSRWGAAEQIKKNAPLTQDEWETGARKLFSTQQWQQSATSVLHPGKPWAEQTSGRAFEAPWAKDIAYREDDIPRDRYKAMLANEKASGLAEPKTPDEMRRRQAERVMRYNNMVKDRYQASLPTGDAPSILGDIMDIWRLND